jgi:hypothetical protein
MQLTLMILSTSFFELTTLLVIIVNHTETIVNPNDLAPYRIAYRFSVFCNDANSLIATSRLARWSNNRATKLLGEIGAVGAQYQDKMLRYLPCKPIQCDEIWA